MIYIVAASKGAAQDCAAQSNLRPTEWTYLHSDYQLRGTSRAVVWLHESARHRDNLAELHREALATRAMVIPKPIVSDELLYREPEAPQQTSERLRFKFKSERDQDGITLTVICNELTSESYRIGKTELAHSWMKPGEMMKMTYRALQRKLTERLQASSKTPLKHPIGLNSERRTGRSTAQALRLIADAISSPFVPIRIKDHAGTRAADKQLSIMIHDTIQALGLRHLSVRLSHSNGYHLIFGLTGDSESGDQVQ